MNANNDIWVCVGTINDIPKRGARCIRNGETTIAVFRTNDDRFFALEDRCPHNNGQLSQGIVHDGCVTCPLHNWVISLESGTACGADEGSTRTFPVRITDSKIHLDLSQVHALPHHVMIERKD